MSAKLMLRSGDPIRYKCETDRTLMAVTRPSVSARLSAQLWSVLMCSMMMHGRNNNGKKMMTVRIVNYAFEIIHLLTDKNPLHVMP